MSNYQTVSGNEAAGNVAVFNLVAPIKIRTSGGIDNIQEKDGMQGFGSGYPDPHYLSCWIRIRIRIPAKMTHKNRKKSRISCF
jgi:hypothetical protein